MAERSKDLLRLEHKDVPLSSLESTLLFCDKRDSSTQTQKRTPDGMPLTAPVARSQLLGKVKGFLGMMSEANKQLELDAKDNPKNFDLEELTGNESEVVEMDLMLGVADLHTPEAVAAAEAAISSCQDAIPLVANGSEAGSDDSSADDENVDGESNDEHDGGNDGKKSPSLIQRSISGEDNFLQKQKRKYNSRKRLKIVELS